MTTNTIRPFTPAPAVEGIVRRATSVRTPDGIVLDGTLRLPPDAALPAPAVLLNPPGPAGVSDQTVVTGYADRLAAAGYVTVAFDPRTFGRSGGSPRQHFDITERLRDLQAAVSHLTGLREIVDPSRIGVFGVSAGASVAMLLAAHDPRVGAFVGVGGGYFHPRMLRDAMPAGAFDAQLREAVAVAEHYHRTGELDHVPVATPDGTGAFLPGIEPFPTEPYDYYGTGRGASDRFENRISTASRLSLLDFDYLTPAEFMADRAGLLMAGTDDVYVPLEGTREAHRRLSGPRELVMVEGANHIDLYDNAPFVATVIEATVSWFGAHL